MSKKKSTTVTNLLAIAPRQYPDLHEHLERLESEGLLIRVKEPVDKDQEMHPLVRWQFRGGIKEKDRKAFLFEKPVDGKGKPPAEMPDLLDLPQRGHRIQKRLTK